MTMRILGSKTEDGSHSRKEFRACSFGIVTHIYSEAGDPSSPRIVYYPAMLTFENREIVLGGSTPSRTRAEDTLADALKWWPW